jgi:fatty acid desaturase
MMADYRKMGMGFAARKFWDWDGPTILVAIAIYTFWAALIWFHRAIPWWMEMPIGAYLIAWQFSLQHEAIHSFRGVPAWLRLALVFPPLGLWFPYPLYRKSHSTHHRNTYLTVPGVDTESYYVKKAEWAAASPLWRSVLLFNQTLLGRMTIGPLLRLAKLTEREIGRVRRGDRSHLKHWAVHVVALAVLFWYVSGVCGMAWWYYILVIAYPGFGLGLLRSFIEHRAATKVGGRVATVESNPVFSLLFLYNNLHAVHHLKPTLAWYRIPGYYRVNREKVLNHNGNFFFKGYREIARRYLVKPVFIPIHPVH